MGTRVTPIAYAVNEERSSPKFARAFADGCGGLAVPDDLLLPGPVAMFGSPARWDLLQKAIREGRTWYYGDHGYFHRFRYYRITKNGYQHPGTGEARLSRLQDLRIPLHPEWRKDGSAIVICPNSPVYMGLFGIDAQQWVLDTIGAIQKVSDRPIIVRWKAQAQRRPLYVDLHDAWMVVTFSSASAVEAIAAGVPVCTLAPWASTARMGIQDLSQVEQPIHPPGREQFLANLLANQWTLDEISQGLAWKALRDA